MLDTTIRRQAKLTQIRHEPSYKRTEHRFKISLAIVFLVGVPVVQSLVLCVTKIKETLSVDQKH